jgi:hypothetical protein
MTVDRELVTRKMLLIVRDLDAVRPLAAKPAAEYLQSGFDSRLVLEGLQAALQDVPLFPQRIQQYIGRT